MLYYFNAEHPWVVLLRQGSTSFIGAGSEMRKLGVPEIPEINEGQIKLPSPEGLFRLNTVMLQSKDIIYLGSDGRDDLLMKDAVTGRDSMNMDESLFLKAIEMAGNKLHAIRDYLQGHGEFTDDLSLMSVSFSSEENLVTDKSLRKQSIEQGLANVAAIGESRNFASAAAFAEDCTKKFPEISSFYRLAGFYHRKSGNMQAAADYGEAYRIRKGADVRNLLHLAGIYIRLGNHNRAKVLVQKAQTLSPKDERVKKAVYALRL